MPLRERLRRHFRRTSTSSSDTSDPLRKTSLFYQPGEKLPIKYRRPADPEHTKKMEGFSFAEAWKLNRRHSGLSACSPGASRAVSRRNSYIGRQELALSALRNAGVEQEQQEDDFDVAGAVAQNRRRSSTVTSAGLSTRDLGYAMNRLSTIQSVQTRNSGDSPRLDSSVQSSSFADTTGTGKAGSRRSDIIMDPLDETRPVDAVGNNA